MFHQVRKWMLRIDETKYHSKSWRPSLMLIVDDLDLPLIDFCNNLKKGGLYVLGKPVNMDVNEFGQRCASIRRGWYEFIGQTGIKALPHIVVSEPGSKSLGS
eukprot:GABV01001248.1.p2 GENE.GABV01001248.1~~GABV01001248.1.p2  ORF type:complete len:111 (-),score=30.69 GABV01001248.1:617-922(-)